MTRRSPCLAAASIAWLALSWTPLNAQEKRTPVEVPDVENRVTVNPAAKDTPQISQWIRQLDDERFQAREAATAALIKAGQGAVAPLAKAAAEAGLEVTVRATHILTRLGVSDDPTTADNARLALERLSDSKTAAVRERADAALETLDALEADNALKKIEESGGFFGPAEYVSGAESALAPLTLQEGKWTGGADGLRQLRFLRDVKMVAVHLKLTDDAVPHLAKLKHLRVLRLYSTAISAKGHAKIKAALPGVTLDIRGGQLGIRGDTTAARCMVRHVSRNTAASKADVQPGDIIVKCDGNPVETFPAFVEMMRPKPAGTKVKLEILRGDKTLERELTLEVWRDLAAEDQPEPDPLPR